MSDTDTIQVTLPSGKVASLRNYTTRADDRVFEQGKYRNSFVDDTGTVKVMVADAMGARESYVLRLTLSIDGDSNTQKQIDDMRTADYEVLSSEIDKIVEANNPKAQ